MLTEPSPYESNSYHQGSAQTRHSYPPYNPDYQWQAPSTAYSNNHHYQQQDQTPSAPPQPPESQQSQYGSAPGENTSARTNRSSGPRASLYDHWKEGMKDLELDYQIYKSDLKQSYRDSMRAVRKVYRGTERAVNDTARETKSICHSVQNDLQSQYRGLKQEVRTQKQLMKQDFRELIDYGRAWKQKVVARRSRTNSQSSTNSQDTSNNSNSQQQTRSPHGSTPSRACSREELLEWRVQAIRDWEHQMADPATMVPHLNHLIESKLTTPNELIQYYQGKPELKQFTLEKELTRMQYLVLTEDGRRLADVDSIRAYAGTFHSERDPLDEVLWRAANQSLFGDVITSLTSPQGLVRPQFSTATCVDDVSMTIDCSCQRAPYPLLRGECFLNVSIPGQEGERLPLAGALVEVFFCPRANQVEARILHFSPCPPLSEEQVRGAATNGLP